MMEVSIAFGDGVPVEPIMAEGRDNYEEYDIKNFENDIMFQEVNYDSLQEEQEEDYNEALNAAVVEAEPEVAAAAAATKVGKLPETTRTSSSSSTAAVSKSTTRSSTTTTTQVTTPSTTSVTTSGITPLVVEDPVDKEATTIYRDLLVKLKDSLSQRWVLAKRRRK